MLTKEERKAIAERIGKEFDYTENDEVYEALIGEEIPDNTTWGTDCKVVRDRLIELCDTSSMIDLPLDKDGEVIHIGDTVFYTDGNKVVVDSLRYCAEYGCVVICNDDNSICTYSGNELTHKSPVTAKSLAQRIKYVLENEATSIGVSPYVELGRIAEQLESLGDSND